MRTKTLISMMILCGSTAALAQMTTPSTDPMMANNTVLSNEVMANDMDANMTLPTDPIGTADDATPPVTGEDVPMESNAPPMGADMPMR